MLSVCSPEDERERGPLSSSFPAPRHAAFFFFFFSRGVYDNRIEFREKVFALARRYAPWRKT